MSERMVNCNFCFSKQPQSEANLPNCHGCFLQKQDELQKMFDEYNKMYHGQFQQEFQQEVQQEVQQEHQGVHVDQDIEIVFKSYQPHPH